jgi:hypothetical protein
MGWCLPAEDESLELTQQEARTGNDIVTSVSVPVKLGMVQVEASFGSLAWAGMYYPKPRVENTAIVIHAQIVGAQVRTASMISRAVVCTYCMHICGCKLSNSMLQHSGQCDSSR